MGKNRTVATMAVLFFAALFLVSRGYTETSDTAGILKNDTAFGLINDSGTKISLYYEGDNIKDEDNIHDNRIFSRAVIPGGDVIKISFSHHQVANLQDSHRTVPRNFENMQGDIFTIPGADAIALLKKKRYLYAIEDCLLVDDDFLRSRKILKYLLADTFFSSDFLINASIDTKKYSVLNAETDIPLAQIEKVKGRGIQQGWRVARTENGIDFYWILFERQGMDVLKSLVMVAPDRMVFLDNKAQYNPISTWRVDDQGETGPGECMPIYIAEHNNKIELGTLESGAEGGNILLYEESDGQFVERASAYRYWSAS
jgi:hypothetical protein